MSYEHSSLKEAAEIPEPNWINVLLYSRIFCVNWLFPLPCSNRAIELLALGWASATYQFCQFRILMTLGLICEMKMSLSLYAKYVLGVLWQRSGNLKVSQCTLEGNSAAEGGAFSLEVSSSTLNSSIVQKNIYQAWNKPKLHFCASSVLIWRFSTFVVWCCHLGGSW